LLTRDYIKIRHPEWINNATLYEVNIRQYTNEGTFQAFIPHIHRIKALGVDILWLMPIHPIGLTHRKGSLGSYYAVRDFRSVNPEFGSPEDLKILIKTAHDSGMKVIIDWVGNHSAPDNPLTDSNPEWYIKNRKGEFQSTAWFDWDDIIEFDYSNTELRQYMIDSMCFWVQEFDIDGFRCDAAGFIPVSFWNESRKTLDAIKPVFMLAEWESRDLHEYAFDATYGWGLWGTLRAIALGEVPLSQLIEYIAHEVNAFPRDGIRLNFVENHDKNSWDGNQFTYFGDALYLAIVTACVFPGMPMIYSGQEAGLDKSLAFFDKDNIVWQDNPIGRLYQTLFELKHRNQALWNGSAGGEMIRIRNNCEGQIISFIRVKDEATILGILNFSKEVVNVKLEIDFDSGTYTNVFSGLSEVIDSDTSFCLSGWGYLVFEKFGI